MLSASRFEAGRQLRPATTQGQPLARCALWTASSRQPAGYATANVSSCHGSFLESRGPLSDRNGVSAVEFAWLPTSGQSPSEVVQGYRIFAVEHPP